MIASRRHGLIMYPTAHWFRLLQEFSKYGVWQGFGGHDGCLRSPGAAREEQSEWFAIASRLGPVGTGGLESVGRSG